MAIGGDSFGVGDIGGIFGQCLGFFGVILFIIINFFFFFFFFFSGGVGEEGVMCWHIFVYVYIENLGMNCRFWWNIYIRLIDIQGVKSDKMSYLDQETFCKDFGVHLLILLYLHVYIHGWMDGCTHVLILLRSLLNMYAHT